MTHQMTRDLEASLQAERAGDAFAARELHARIPMFRRSAHQVLLAQLAGLEQEMTPWIWARWAGYQCTRVDGLHGTGLIQRQALGLVLERCYQEDLRQAFEAGADHVRVTARVAGESWVFHQVCTFDLGGLHSFVAEHATGPLRERSATARAWTLAPMGGYRVHESQHGRLRITDLANRRDIEILDLGAAVHADSDGMVIGRLVPTGMRAPVPSMMFDSRPLPVDEETARAVAARPTPLGWVDLLATACDEGRVDRSRIDSEDREMVTDVPSLLLVERGTSPSALAATMESLRCGRDEVGRAAFRVLEQVSRGAFGPDADAAYVAAAVLNAHAHSEAWRCLSTATPAERWQRWSDLVPDPARARLRRLADCAVRAS